MGQDLYFSRARGHTVLRKIRLAVLLGISLLPPLLQRWAYALLFGARFGRGVRIGVFSFIDCQKIELGNFVNIGRNVRIVAKSVQLQGECRIGPGVRITVNRLVMAWRAIIDESVVVAGEHLDSRSLLVMGMHSWVFPQCVVDVRRQVMMGRNVGVGGRSLLFTHGYWLSKVQGFPTSYAPVRLGNDVWIPWNCFIMPGVEIGNRVVVGACSLVTRSVPDDALVAGVPAKVVRERSARVLTEPEQIAVATELVDEYLASTSPASTRTGDGAEFLWSEGGQKTFAVTATLETACARYQRTDNLKLILVLGEISESAVALSTLPLCSLATGITTPEALLDSGALDLLRWSRRVGVRSYHADEWIESERLLEEFRPGQH